MRRVAYIIGPDVAAALGRGEDDATIATSLGVSVRTVRRARGMLGILRQPEAAPAVPATLFRELHAAGCSPRDLAECTGYRLSSVYQRCHELGLRARRGPAPRVALPWTTDEDGALVRRQVRTGTTIARVVGCTAQILTGDLDHTIRADSTEELRSMVDASLRGPMIRYFLL